MSTTSDKVVIEEVWKLRDQATPGIKNLQREARLLGLSMSHLRESNLFALAGSAAALTVAVAGTAKLGQSVIKVSDELERMKYGMGAILMQAQNLGFASLGLKDMNDALREGGNLYQRLFVYSQKAVGTADDYVNAWRDIGQAVLQAGGSIAQTEQITQLLVPLTKQFGILAEAGARDIRQFLMGQMTQRDVIPRMLGITNVEEVNQRMSMMQRLNLLIEKMETGRAGTKAYESTFGAQFDTFKSLIVQMQRVGGEGFFDQVKNDLKAFNDMFLSNEKRVYEYARRIANEMKDAYTTVRDAVTWVVTHFREIVAASKIILGIWISMKVASKSIALYQSFQSWVKAMGGWEAIRATSNLKDLTKGIGLLGPAIAGTTLLVLGALDAVRKDMAKQKAGQEAQAKTQSEWDAIVKAAEQARDPLNLGQSGLTRWDLIDRKIIPDDTWMAMVNESLAASRARAEAESAAQAARFASVQNSREGAVAMPSSVRSTVDWSKQQEMYREEMAKRILEWQGFTPNVMGEPAKIEPPKPPDFRGSHITINVDSRHADPNRVAATVINSIGRMARSKTGGRGGLVGAATTGG